VRHARTIQLGIAIQGDAPPDRFRIFTAGKVETSKGVFIFDADAAAAVMADYEAQGNELMVDYDHASLSALAVDPALAARAAGWFGLELAADGSLWAVNVRWTEPAAAALSRKEWRYMSPAFATEGDRIVSLMNVALTNMPATRRLDPLMAASRKEHTMSSSLTLEEIATVAKALKMPPDSTLSDFMAKLGIPEAPAAVEAPRAEEPAPPVEEEAMAEAPVVEEPKGEEDEEKTSLVVSSRVREMTGATTDAEALSRITRALGIAADYDARMADVAKQQAAIELSKRKANAAAFVKLGVETPATSGLVDGKLCARLLAEPLDEQDARLAALSAGRSAPLAIRAPVVTDDAPAVSDRELAMFVELKLTPDQIKTYAANKAANAKKAS
jgi:phage I-like protein